MKILLDPQIFYLQRFGGISRYYTEMYRVLKKQKKVTINCPLLISDNLHLNNYNLQPKLIPFFSKIKGINRLFLFDKVEKSKRLVLAVLQNKKVDIYIPTYYDTYFLFSIACTPFVLTVYDMIHELFPSYFPDDITTVPNKKILIERATRIIAISENTKKDILKIYPFIDSSKIDVVYLSHSIVIDKTFKIEDNEAPYLLFVGNRGGYKNFIFFIEAVTEWVLDNMYKVYCLGGGKFTDIELNTIDSLGLTGFILQIDFKDDHELANYYFNAFAFIFPSEYEGFGIPVLEAMACKCPVILPSASSFPEVAGEAGIYYNSNDSLSLLNSLQILQKEGNLRKCKIELGFKQQAKFSWEKTASECLSVYKKVISH